MSTRKLAAILFADIVGVMEPTTMHHAGERYGGIKDLTGKIWRIATHIEDVSQKEEAMRIKQMKKFEK